MKKKLKVSTKEQLYKLIAYMEENPDIARGMPNFGSSRALVANKWEKLAQELNSCGPPRRTGEEWKRVWINYKGNLKRKLYKNKKNLTATCGGPSSEVSLTAMEQSVLDLINVAKPANPSDRTFGLNISSSSNEEETTCNTTSNIENEPPQTSQKRRQNVRKSVEEERLQQLKLQGSIQTEILSTLKNMDSTLYKSYKLNQKYYDLKVKENEILIRQKAAEIELTQLKFKKMKQEMGI